jgi:acetyltransferase-like isoleucine patch superfamily enzyme
MGNHYSVSAAGKLLLKWRSLATRVAAIWWSGWYTIYLRCHPGVKMAGRITVSGRMIWRLDPRGRLTLGQNVRIHSGSRVNAFGGHRRAIVWVLPGGHLTIKDGAGLSSSTLVCQERLTIGAQAMIGGGCDIIDTDFHPLDRSARIAHDNSVVRTSPVAIGRGAWIGGKVMVLKGVTIGEDAIIGAASVVTRSVPAGETWAGNPARRISPRVAP